MRIAVCIKQVPVVAAMQFDASTRTLKRDGVPNEVSAFDVRALIKAVELTQQHGGEVVVITMGPPQAAQALEYCLALGADRALHLCDPAFAGADTLATAQALALALRRESYDLILCGRNSVDAETGQVGPEIAELLDLPQITAVHALTIDPRSGHVTAERETDTGFETIRTRMPVLISAAEDLAAERFPSKVDREAAKTKPCAVVTAAELTTDASQLGLAGSPTAVLELDRIETKRLGRVLEGTVEAVTAELATLLVESHGLFGHWKVQEQPTLASIPLSVQRSTPADVWVVAETHAHSIRLVVLELLGKAAELARTTTSGQVTAVLLGEDVEPHCQTLAQHGADRILLADDPRLAPVITEVHTDLLSKAIRAAAPGIVLFPSTTIGRDLAPRVAARLQLGLTGDCVDLGMDDRGRLLQYKPAFGGAIVAPIVSRTLPEMATVRPGMLAMPIADLSRTAVVEHLSLQGLAPSRVEVLEQRHGADGRAGAGSCRDCAGDRGWPWQS